MTVMHFSKTLAEPPAVAPDSFGAREFRGLSDAQAWLDLRNSAMRTQTRKGRDWELADFQREFLDQQWFDPDCCWLSRPARSPGNPSAVGSLVLRLDRRDAAIIRWLLVAPHFRRQGIGSQLLALAERTAWQRGRRRIQLETLSTWQPALQFYEAHGYRIV